MSKCKLFFSLHFVIAVAEVTDSNTLIYLKKKKEKSVIPDTQEALPMSKVAKQRYFHKRPPELKAGNIRKLRTITTTARANNLLYRDRISFMQC